MSNAVIEMEHSEYRIEYPCGDPNNYRVFRGDEDVTVWLENVLVLDLIIEIDSYRKLLLT